MISGLSHYHFGCITGYYNLWQHPMSAEYEMELERVIVQTWTEIEPAHIVSFARISNRTYYPNHTSP